jgi:hypothetical protein
MWKTWGTYDYSNSHFNNRLQIGCHNNAPPVEADVRAINEEKMEHRNLVEVFGSEAKIQLFFLSYMKMAILICLCISITVSVFLNMINSVIYAPGEHWGSAVIWLNAYMFFGSLFLGLIGSALSYPVYLFWCNNIKGQSVIGKFSILVDSSNKSFQSTH